MQTVAPVKSRMDDGSLQDRLRQAQALAADLERRSTVVRRHVERASVLLTLTSPDAGRQLLAELDEAARDDPDLAPWLAPLRAAAEAATRLAEAA
jgi:hypothetical protein